MPCRRTDPLPSAADFTIIGPRLHIHERVPTNDPVGDTRDGTPTAMNARRAWQALCGSNWLLVALGCVLVLGGGLLWNPDATADMQHFLRAHHATLLGWQAAAPVAFLCAFFLAFVLVSALTLPGGTPLCLLAGSLFGTVGGTAVLGLASTVGALLSFLAARHFARERAERLLGHRMRTVDKLLSRRAGLRLFWVRVVPLVPFPVLNPLLGLSRLSTGGFFWPSLAGLTLTSAPYAWAGESLGELLAGESGWLPLAGACASLLLLWILWRHDSGQHGGEETA
jgi:uncharacterized membrane protein YdjX (TVP38/TMEM64 family)